MLRTIQVIFVLFIFFISHTTLSQVTKIQQADNDTTQNTIAPKLHGNPERTIKFAYDLLSKDFQLSLNTTDLRKFDVQFPNNGKKEVTVKVYDIIGNLILVDRTIILSNYKKTFDMTRFNSNVFIVEVNNGGTVKTRSIYTGVTPN